MKNFYTTTLAVLYSMAMYAQVQVDHSILLTGSGSDGRLSGIQSVTNSTDAVSVQALQNGNLVYVQASGSNNALNISPNPAVTSYITGMIFYFRSNQSVTGPATLSINGLAATPIVKYTNVALSGCEIVNGQIVKVIYDGTNFQIASLTPVAQVVSTPVATAATNLSQTSFTANWNASANATSYYLDVATDAGFTNILSGYNNLNIGNNTTYNVASGIACGNTYFYRVRGTNVCGASANSNTISVAIQAQPNNVPITITNSATAATGTNFQQKITVNSSTYSAYESTGLQNVEFTVGGPAGTGTVLQAWLESGNTTSSTSTIYWVNLGSTSIAANGGTLIIYMNFMPSNVMSGSGPTGLAPQLSSTYGQLDNGSSVFTFYDNFAGTTVNTTKWKSNGSNCYSINNGLTYIICSNADFLETNTTFTNIVIDQYLEPTNGGWVGFSVPGAYGSHVGVLFYNQLGWSMYNGSSQIADSKSYTQNVFYVITAAMSGGLAKLDINYTADLTSTASYYPNTAGSLQLANGAQGSGFVQWMRARNYPPVYTMPGVSFGAVVPSSC